MIYFEIDDYELVRSTVEKNLFIFLFFLYRHNVAKCYLFDETGTLTRNYHQFHCPLTLSQYLVLRMTLPSYKTIMNSIILFLNY